MAYRRDNFILQFIDSACLPPKKYSQQDQYPAHSLDELLDDVPKNQTIVNNLIRAWNIINNDKYKKIVCSVSGGSDSDIMVDICVRADIHHKIKYVYFNTGLEYTATKDHIKYLENKYGINIENFEAWQHGMTIPNSCKTYGQPFCNKTESEFIHRLQIHDFKWEHKPFQELYAEYPQCKSALQWWCNMNKGIRNNISWNKWLKEFLIENPPTFLISNMCCKKSKKDVSRKIKCDLRIVGVRKAEGGARATAYKNCFSEKSGDSDEYRPLFWYTNYDKCLYEKYYGIEHSKCYTEYGLKRTGCCGCPYGRNLEFELEILKEHEQNLYKAVCNVFKDSYEYTRQYRDFCQKMNRNTKGYHQMSIDDFI
jgi:3'-phosphoadenosine 5'-phosphosulfate sulfotransferase (PAPS reductase)/FAD synthetase